MRFEEFEQLNVFLKQDFFITELQLSKGRTLQANTFQSSFIPAAEYPTPRQQFWLENIG